MTEPLKLESLTLYEGNDLAVLRQVEDALSQALKEIVTLPETRLKGTLKVHQIMEELLVIRKRVRMDVKNISHGFYRENPSA